MKIVINQPLNILEVGKRANQEDSLYPSSQIANANSRIFLLCDGMGGHEKGEVASQCVANRLGSYISQHLGEDEVLSDSLFLEALSYTYNQLDQLDQKDTGKKMGTTLTFLCLHKGGATIGHMGDSRIYHIRPSEGKILYISRDHSTVFNLYQAGEITYEEMKTSPIKNQITRAMMPGTDNRMKVDLTHVTDIKVGDYFYMCSDGMLEQMEDDEILRIFSEQNSDSVKQDSLITATKNNSDNHSAWIIPVTEVYAEPDNIRYIDDEQAVRWNAVNIHPVYENAPEVQVLDDEEGVVKPIRPATANRQRNQVQTKKKITWPYFAITLLLFATIIIALLAITKLSLSNKAAEQRQQRQQTVEHKRQTIRNTKLSYPWSSMNIPLTNRENN